MIELQMIYTVLVFQVISSLGIMQLFVKRSLSLSSEHRRIFSLLYMVIGVAAFCEWLGYILQGGPANTRIIHILAKAIELSIAPSIGFLFAAILDNRRKWLAFAVLAAHAVLEFLSGCFGFIYRVDAANVYSHEQFYFIYVAFYAFSAVYCLVVVLHNIKKYQYSGSAIFALLMCWMMAGVIIQLVDSSIKVSYIAVCITSVMAYVFVSEMIQQTDALTELLNRRGYENYILHIEKKCLIIFFDVDKFKQLNDQYGHACGDAVLKEIGTTIKKCYAPYGKCFRYGGDEFCAILEKNIENIEEINTGFFREMQIKRDENPILPHVSSGHALFVPGSDNITDVVKTADEMMYRYKQAHRGIPPEQV